MTKQEFIAATAKRAGVTQGAAEAIINAALNVATMELINGRGIKLQKFGTLDVRERQTRGRDFTTGEVLPAKSHKYAHFEAADSLKAAMNGGIE